MLKKYTSKSDIAISVPLKSGRSAHLSFSPLTGGGSVFYTDDAELQEALERHPRFGRLFTLADGQPKGALASRLTTRRCGAAANATEAGSRTDAGDMSRCGAAAYATEASPDPSGGRGGKCEPDEGEVTDEGDPTDATDAGVPLPTLKEIHIDNLDDAKEYLCDHFGLSRTKLRYRKNIVEAATANGVEFVGI